MLFISTIRSLPALGVLLFFVAFIPGTATAGDPDLVFYTLKTEHFNIHYWKELEHTARKAAALAEEIHDELTTVFGWEVNGPTEIVLTDSTDSSNGSAAASPRPLIRLFASSPVMDTDMSALSNHDDWMRTLITHEYTHIIHLQMNSGFARVINTIFGDVYLPNQMQPRWFIEGLAVLDESEFTSEGRVYSSVFNMVVRMNALEGKLLSLGEISNNTVAFPRGHGHYIYGAMFMSYLYNRFGMEKLVQICHEYGSSTIPYGINRVFKRVLDVDLITLYDEWKKALTAEAIETKRRIEAEGLSSSQALTDDGELKGRPVFTPDGQNIILPIQNGLTKSGILMIPFQGDGARKYLAYSGVKASITIDRSGHIYFTRTAPYKNYYRYSDAFVLMRPGAKPKRLTHGLRAREAAISPKGDRLALTVNKAGTTKLVIADERGNPIKTLIDSLPDDQVYDPQWSPDGKKLAVVIRKNEMVNLYLADVETNELSMLTHDLALESTPVFSSDGRYVVFSSERNKISNIYAYDLSDGRMLRITNVLGGAIYPAISPDGKTMAFLRFTSKGWDLHTTKFNPSAGKEVQAYLLEESLGAPDPEIENLESTPYNPLPSLLPRFWMIGMTTAGDQSILQTELSMSDSVGLHSINVNFNHPMHKRELSTHVSYSFLGMNPGFGLGFNRRVVPRDEGYLVGGDARTWDQEIVGGVAALSFVLPGLDRNHHLNISYSITHARPVENLKIECDPNGDLPHLPTQYFRAGMELGWSFSDLKSSTWGVSPEGGRALSAKISFYHPSLGGNQELVGFFYSWKEYFEAFWLKHHVFALRLNGGVYVSNPPEQAGFTVGGYADQNMIDALWNSIPQGVPSLRGYPVGAFSGDQFHSLKLEYRFPLWWAESAYNTLPLFLRRLHGSIFTDNVLITFDALDRDDWRTTIGAELIWSISFGYYMPVTLRVGYARGLMEKGTNEFIFVMGGSF